DMTSAFSWFTFGSKDADFNPLPVQLTYFSAKARLGDVLLNWMTASEKNNAFFAIERSAEGQIFETIGQLNGAGTTQLVQRYEFVDAAPLKGVNFYRLRQVDYDGMVAYSPMRSINWVGTGSGQGQLLLFPSPVQDVLQVQVEESALPETMFDWEILNISGQRVLTGQWAGKRGPWEAPVGQLPKGMYLLRCSAGPLSWSKTFVKSGY
ncbi:MAG: T9SS type A sorting domain-containing protein, partial [Saprospiraceae bacterium]|nr:T9SS type A sorting domain-containing protein [Saprospiraceae bacterium]